MRRVLLSLTILLSSIWVCGAVHSSPNADVLLKNALNTNADYTALNNDIKNLNLDDFLNLTPKQYKEMTGQKLGIKNAIKLKAAQKFLKKKQAGDPDIPKGVYILGAIFGFAWILMGVMDDFEGNNWWISLLLFVLCWLPGVIHAFIKMDEYY